MWTKEGRLFVSNLFMANAAMNSIVARLAKDYPSGIADEDLVYGDLDECDFDGYVYAALTPVTTPAALNGSGQGQGRTALLTFTAGSGISAPQTIKAIWLDVLDGGGGHHLVWIKKLTPTATLANPGEVFQRYIDMFADNLSGL